MPTNYLTSRWPEVTQMPVSLRNAASCCRLKAKVEAATRWMDTSCARAAAPDASRTSRPKSPPTANGAPNVFSLLLFDAPRPSQRVENGTDASPQRSDIVIVPPSSLLLPTVGILQWNHTVFVVEKCLAQISTTVAWPAGSLGSIIPPPFFFFFLPFRYKLYLRFSIISHGTRTNYDNQKKN